MNGRKAFVVFWRTSPSIPSTCSVNECSRSLYLTIQNNTDCYIHMYVSEICMIAIGAFLALYRASLNVLSTWIWMSAIKTYIGLRKNRSVTKTHIALLSRTAQTTRRTAWDGDWCVLMHASLLSIPGRGRGKSSSRWRTGKHVIPQTGWRKGHSKTNSKQYANQKTKKTEQKNERRREKKKSSRICIMSNTKYSQKHTTPLLILYG